VIIAVFGTLGGVILGTFLGWAVVRSSGSASLAVFAAPPLQLVLFLVLGAVTGILAGVRPARRAARLNMISAIAAGRACADPAGVLASSSGSAQGRGNSDE
jgi:putative ABC transport system permease protein